MENIAGIIESMGQLPFFLQALFGFMIFVAFSIILFFGFGKRWKGLLSLLREINETKEDGFKAIDDIGVAMKLKSLTDDIDKETKIRILRRTRKYIYSVMDSYIVDCPLIVYNLRVEFENIVKDYIAENHLVKKSYAHNIEYESERLSQGLKDMCEKSNLLSTTTSCNVKKSVKWESIEGEVIDAVSSIMKILKEEVVGSINEKLLLYSNTDFEIQNERVKKYVITEPQERNKDYLKKINNE